MLALIMPAQNLVPNGSFEILDSCPTFNDLYLANPWCGTSGDEDVYNACGDPMFQASVPFNYYNMFQYARTGAGYTGLDFYIETGPFDYQRNYAHIPLIQSLQTSKKYVVSYFINLSNDSQYAISNIDAWLTPNQPNCNINSAFSFTTIVVNPQIKNNNGILTDTLNWIQVCDTLTAAGNEAYLVLGNFNTNANTNVVKAYPSAPRQICLVNVDDVSVEELKIAKCKNDTLLMQGDSLVIGNNTSEAAIYN